MEIPNNAKGFLTSIDIVRKQTFKTTAIAGNKRSHAQITNLNAAEHGSILSDRTNTCSGYGFHRPTVSSSGKPRLQASGIRPASSTGGQVDAISEYSQRKALASTPGPAENPLLSLSHPRYGLPDALVRNFAAAGINAIYPWQSACLSGRNILQGTKNLVYTAPTGGGKSLVADVLMLKKVIENPTKKAILVLPYVALVQEKLKWLRRIVDGVQKNVDSPSQGVGQRGKWDKRVDHSEVRVVGFFGGSKARATWTDLDIAVCTIEKVIISPVPSSGIGELSAFAGEFFGQRRYRGGHHRGLRCCSNGRITYD